MKRTKRLFFGVLVITLVMLVMLASCHSGGATTETSKETKFETAEQTLEAVQTQEETEEVTAEVTEQTADETENQVQEASTVATEEVTIAQTQEPVAETEASQETQGDLWHPETGIFNLDKVTYVKEEETYIIEAFPEDALGKPVSPLDKGVSVVFSNDFSGDDPLCGGKAVTFYQGSVTIQDGKLILPYDAEAPNQISSAWTTWSPTSPASVKDSLQVQLSTKWEIFSVDKGAWMTAMWGCYVTNYAGKIPDNPGDGLWLSFQKNANKITVYHPDTQSWAEGWADIPVSEGILEGQHQVDIVCMPNYTTYVYITPSNSQTAELVATILFEDGKIKAYDQANHLVKEDDCTTASLQGENFSLFVHGGGGAWVDEVNIMECSHGEIGKNTTITATPVGDNTLGLDITNKTDLVSICYSVWFDAILGNGTEPVTDWNNITEALAGTRPWGGMTAFHYWAKPAQGYYRSSDKTAIRNNMTMLYEAGVDFVVIDLTNAGDGYIGTSAWVSYVQRPMDAMLDTIMEMRAEGKGTPYVVFWCGDSNGPLYQALYDNYHAVEKWQDCFVYWDGKPLFLTTHTSPEDFPLQGLFTLRQMWGLNNEHGTNQWSFLNINNHGTVSRDANGNPEQISVAVATQETYMSEPSAHGRNGGIFWYVQWHYAFEVHPKIVGLTWWNEWTAQRFDFNGNPYSFVDNYTQEYSRDIEPMEGGHGDQYYQWLKQYIAHYKAGKECPVLVEETHLKKVAVELKKAQRYAYKP